jgi:hypothetical protein
MDDQFEKNLKAIKQEFEAGLKMMAELESRRSNLRGSLDHISGTIQEYRKRYMEDRIAADEQTGKMFVLTPEKPWDIVAAAFSSLYLVVMLVFLSWLLFEICVGKGTLINWFGLINVADKGLFRLIACTVIGGGLGGVVNGIRSLVVWHSERMAFGWRFVWKYVTHPLLGIILAAIVYAILRGGIAAVAGDITLEGDATPQSLAAFAIGALSGYGSHKVLIWLDGHVNKLFKVSQAEMVHVPNVVGKSREDAEKMLKDVKLILGAVHEQPTEKAEDIGKVIRQDPAADSLITAGGKVNITMGVKKRAKPDA